MYMYSDGEDAVYFGLFAALLRMNSQVWIIESRVSARSSMGLWTF